EANSAGALLFEIWLSSHLRPALLARVAPDETLRAMLVPGDIVSVVRLLEGLHPGLSQKAGLEDQDAVLATTLTSAWDDACARFGNDPQTWAWGALHKGWFSHPLGAVQPNLNVGPFDKGGSSTSLMLAHYDAADYRVRVGASVRMVVDVGAWDNSVWINAPGQSGLPDSRHHSDLAPLWARGKYVPMLYSDDAVDAATVETITLVPAD
ncbi:MAG: penicillin acylase family protein, partial [Sedimentitalea sp.]